MADPGGTDDATLAAIERALVRIRRSMTRRSLGTRALRELGAPVDPSHLAVVDAVEEGPDPSGGGVTVGMVGERLGIDPSRASRVVAAAVQAGYVLRTASQADGRRVTLELTDEGRALVAAVHRFRRRACDEAMRGWPEAERRDFARLLARFVDGAVAG